ncbi:MAG: hypothetical protein JRG84_03435 [Deltaproteobacteria bacterium]|nr:hypothetical protein [Deltaproteobacteria bacterium]
MLRHLGEVDARRLYLEEACSSMFVYCVRVLHFSEAAAYKRIRAARAARRHPELLLALRRGELHVTALSLLAAQLTGENCGEWIRAARHQTAEEIKRLLADRQPKPDLANCVRRLPAQGRSGSVSAEALVAEAATVARASAPAAAKASECAEVSGRKTDSAGGKPGWAPDRAVRAPGGVASRGASHSRTSPLGSERYRVCFTADGELHAQLVELRALMRHQIPDGDLGIILARAVALLLDQVRKRKFGAVSRPKPEAPANHAASRHIPAAIRRAVVRRDAGSCSYVSAGGVRCASAVFLEFHHLDPWAHTGTHSVDGIALRCRAHNQYDARRVFGEEHMARFRKRPGAESGIPAAQDNRAPEV